MGQDILSCRDHIVKLKGVNSALKRQVSELQSPIEGVSSASKEDLAREVRRSRQTIKDQVGVIVQTPCTSAELCIPSPLPSFNS